MLAELLSLAAADSEQSGGSSPLAAAHFMLYVDQTIVSSQITGFSDAVVLLFTSYYCLNISYPSSPRSNIGVLAKISASPTM
ncbi:uncharacterized protein LOC115567474 isoform X4 [Sparus aurata]|uniref:uncharacterized protein LOC115567474 isoform X4 n=1 Tax=Sparus aurata TaxID=8175 RepID=UPI0011C168E4|nr:uncharacterized protein LOC115567474 isoform X4 [Sparus aurata]